MDCTCTIEDTFSNNVCQACMEFYVETFGIPFSYEEREQKSEDYIKTPVKIILYQSDKFKGIVDVTSTWNLFIVKALLRFPSLKFDSVDNAHKFDSTVTSYPTIRLFFADNSYIDYDELRDGPRNVENLLNFIENGKNLEDPPTKEPSSDINVYNFSLYPEKHQPSGAINISSSDNNYSPYNTVPTLGPMPYNFGLYPQVYQPFNTPNVPSMMEEDEFFSHC